MNYQTQRYTPNTQFTVFPPAVKNLILINIVIFVASFTPGIGGFLKAYAPLYPFASPNFYPWQFITYMFMHAGIWHIGFNMFALWMFGQAIENLWGTKRFLIYYFITGIGAGLCFILINSGPVMLSSGQMFYVPTIGASGAVYGILLAFGMMFPNRRIMLLFPPIPLKAKYFVAIFGGLELVMGIGNFCSNVAHFAHVGGIVFGFILIKFWGLKKVE